LLLNEKYLDVKEIIEKVTTMHNKVEFGDFKDIFMSLLEDSSYECIILDNVSKLLEEDAFAESRILYKQRRLPYPTENVKFSEDTKKAGETPGIPVTVSPAGTAPTHSASSILPAIEPNTSLFYETMIRDRISFLQPEEVKMPVFQIFRKLQESVGNDVLPEKRFKVGQELVQTLIPSVESSQPEHVSKVSLFEAQTTIQLGKRKTTDPPPSAKRGGLSEQDALTIFPSQVPVTPSSD